MRLLTCLLLLTTSTIFAQSTSPIASSAELVKISDEFSFTEGPVSDKKGNVYFTDQPNNRIHKWTPGKGISTWMEDAGRANGLTFDDKGNLIVCADEKNELWSISPKKKVTVLLTDLDGKKFNGPNDVWVLPNGGILFTDPFYKREYWDRTEKEIEEENLYYINPVGELSMVDNNFVQPNGIVGTPDGKKLYVADIGDRKTYVYDVDTNGNLSNKRLFTEMGSDGMTLDEKGNVYLTGPGVVIFNPEGEEIERIETGERWTANVCFGGKEFKTLFITAMGSVYTMEMDVKGAR